jgi:hypothetical protein
MINCHLLYPDITPKLTTNNLRITSARSVVPSHGSQAMVAMVSFTEKHEMRLLKKKLHCGKHTTSY